MYTVSQKTCFFNYNLNNNYLITIIFGVLITLVLYLCPARWRYW